MKLAVALAVVIGSSAFAAPTDELILKERAMKSAAPYGAGVPYGASYGPPCAGAAPLAPIALYLAPQGAPHYREDVSEEHSDQQSARSYDGAGYGAASASAISFAPAGAVPGGAVGYFPHAKVGGCAVPLLLSCAPHVVAGHLAASHGYASPAYKQTEKQEETTELKEAVEKSWKEAETDANNLPHHHHLVALTGNHEALEHAHTHKASV